MRIYDPAFVNKLMAAQRDGIAPRYFGWFKAKNRSTGAIEEFGLWSGEKNIAMVVPRAEGGVVSRLFVGGCGFRISDMQYVSDLTDNPVNVSMSQLSDVTQSLVREYDIRMADAELYGSIMDGGAPVTPQLIWIGVADELLIATPEVGGNGNIGFSVRSEIMHQLTKPNPAKSSDEHQKRRSATDDFCQYSGVIKSRDLQWYRKG